MKTFYQFGIQLEFQTNQTPGTQVELQSDKPFGLDFKFLISIGALRLQVWNSIQELPCMLQIISPNPSPAPVPHCRIEF